MDPNQQYPQPGNQQPNYSIDYLDQIAAPAPKKSGPPKILVLGGILIFVLILVIGVAAILTSGPNVTTKSQAYSLRVANLKTAASDQQEYLKDPSLKNSNSTMILLLTTAETNFTNLGVSTGGEDGSASVTASETEHLEILNAELENNRLNATLDTAYPREMAYQLRLLLNDLSAIKKLTKSDSYKTYIDETTESLTPMIEKFDNFYDTESATN